MPAVIHRSNSSCIEEFAPTIEVSARAFGGLVVEVEGESVPPKSWKAANARWLFLYLMLHEGQEISERRLLDLFWPASPPQKGHRALLTSVYRARKALGSSTLIERIDKGYRLGPSCRLWFDVKEFLGYGGQSLSKESAARMVELYRGPFVPECDDVWCGRIRAELEGLHRRALAYLS